MFIKTVLKSFEFHSSFVSAIKDLYNSLITTKDVIIRVVNTIALKQADVNKTIGLSCCTTTLLLFEKR